MSELFRSDMDFVKFMPFDDELLLKEEETESLLLKSDGTKDGLVKVKSFPATLSRVDIVDVEGDKILAGAFADTLKAWKSRRLPMFAFHNQMQGLGYWDNLRMEGALLKAQGNLLMGLPLAQSVALLMEARVLRGVSIGGRKGPEQKLVNRPNGRRGWDIDKVDLFEASIVYRPANLAAKVTQKDQGKEDVPTPDIERIAAELREL